MTATTTSSSKARNDRPESTRKSGPRRTDSRQISKILIQAGGWSKEVPVIEEYSRIDSSKPLDLPQEEPSEPLDCKDYTLSRALQNSRLLDDIDALFSPGQEVKFQVKSSCTEVYSPLARFLSEGREEQACIIALKEEAGGLNISKSPSK